MHKLLKKYGSTALQIALFTTAAIITPQISAGEGCCNYWLDIYAGIDGQVRHMPFQKNFGGNILEHRYPQANVFLGLKFNDYVGIEAGYEFSKKQRSAKNHQPGDIVFGVTVPPPSFIDLSTANASRASSKINGFNFNLVGFLPILCEEYNTQLMGSIGVAALKSRIRSIFTETHVFEILDEVIVQPTSTNNLFKKHKSVLKLSAGIQHMITPCIGIRGLITRENTSKIQTHGINVETGQSLTLAKLRNSHIYSFGVFTSF